MATPNPPSDSAGGGSIFTVFDPSFGNSTTTNNTMPSMAPTRDRNFQVSLGTTPIPTLSPASFPTIPPSQELKASPELTSLGFTMGISTGIFAAVLLFFALAMRLRSTHIAPRCEARPRNVIFNPDPCCDPVQNKGNPFFLGWVFWVLNLSYKELLGGVPGTGTRAGGMKGRMLSVNLDHIILLRFNSLGLKISMMAMLTYCTICLPIYYYARCEWVPLGEVDASYDEDVILNCTNEQNYTFSSYVRFTLANVPDLNSEYFSKDYHLESFLLYMVSIASWLVVWFACFELFHEWIDEVAIRRVYYLEYNHWEGAKDELKRTMLDAIQPQISRGATERVVPEKHLFERPVWIPHPEQRDTPSNVELYSVLVGGIPSRPDEAMNPDDVEEAVIDSQVDWQMELVSTFFDSCVPNMPGYTSSVAAVTILPSATELAIAWSCWYKAAKKLSRLRFIRQRIVELGGTPVGQRLVVDDDDDNNMDTSAQARLRRKSGLESSIRRKEYSAEVLGAGIEDDANDEFWKSLDLGPEQIGVYSLEFSRGLAGCCPHGFCEERISYCKDLDFLLELEAEAADAVTAAYAQLKAAGEVAATSHEKRKDMVKLTDLTTDLLESKADMVPSHHKSTTEMQLMKNRRRGTNGSKHTTGNVTADDIKADIKKSLQADENGGVTSQTVSPKSLAAAQLDYLGGAKKERETWEVVETLAFEAKNNKRRVATPYKVQNGKWAPPTLGRAWRGFRRKVTSLLAWTGDNSNEASDILARDTTFAVVTFTSRQAAIAARQCLADGRGAEAFTAEKALPVPPLADSAAFNACDFRGCTKPVTIGLNETQKAWRKTIVTVAVALLYVFYTIPIGFVSELASRLVFTLFPDIDDDYSMTKTSVEGWLEAQILNLFLAFLPDVFLFLANFGSNATSLVEAENMALRFYWYFMVCFAMIGSSIVKMGKDVYATGSVDISDILQTVARTIPVDVSFTWTNWIITRATTFTPAFYLLQLNSVLSAMFGLRCFARMFRGGGSGNRLPYRIYVENATVLLCSLALAPASPILSPFAVLYFLICTPLLRFVLIFTYKPAFDSGGSRWPALFDTIIVSLVVAQIILCTMLFLKKALGAAIFAFVPVPPVIMFRIRMRNRFLAAFRDAALLQTSSLDGWGMGTESDQLSWEDREEFRRFLVDAHKASFVPVCIAATQGGAKNKLTAEPAEVVWITEEEKRDMESEENEHEVGDRRAFFKNMHREKTQQFGALNRRHLTSGRNLSIPRDEDQSIRRNLGAERIPPTPSRKDLASPAMILEDDESEAKSSRKDSEPAKGSDSKSADPELAEETSSASPSVDETSPPDVLADIEESQSGKERIEVAFEDAAPVKVTRLGNIFASNSGNLEFDFANSSDKRKED